MTRVLHTARISNVDSVIFLDINRSDPNSMQYAGHVSFELFNRPRSPKSLCGSVVEQSEGLRFDSSQGLRIFLCPTLVTKQGNIFLKTCLVCLLTLLWTHTKVRVLSYAMFMHFGLVFKPQKVQFPMVSQLACSHISINGKYI